MSPAQAIKYAFQLDCSRFEIAFDPGSWKGVTVTRSREQHSANLDTL